MGAIYCYTNLVNQKKYIGQSIDPNQRYKAHKSAVYNEKSQEYNAPLHAAMRKYGFENFSYEILQETNDVDLLNEMEIFYISYYNTQIPNGYNILSGGRNALRGAMPVEVKKKLTWAQAKLSEDEVIILRLAYANKESPRAIYDEFYKDKLHYNSFLNIWSGRRYKNIMPEVIENGRHTKLNEDIVREIRLEYKNTKTSYQKLADKYNIPKATIADIIKERTWKNVQI